MEGPEGYDIRRHGEVHAHIWRPPLTGDKAETDFKVTYQHQVEDAEAERREQESMDEYYAYRSRLYMSGGPRY